MRFILPSQRNPAPSRSRFKLACFTLALRPPKDSVIIHRVLKKSCSSFHASLFPLALTALFVAGLCVCRAQTLQFDANHLFTTVVTNSFGQIKTNLVWESFQGVNLVANAADWEKMENATSKPILVNKTGPTASPFLFATNTLPHASAQVQYMVIALRTGPTIRMRECLACGRVIARISDIFDNEPINPVSAVFERGGYCEIAYHKVNNIVNAPLKTSEMQIIEINFGTPLFLNELAIFQDMARVAWGRGFGGPDIEIFELITFPTVPSAGVLTTVHRHLDKRWEMGIGAPSPTTSNIIEAMSQNLRFHNRFSTLLLVR